MQTFLPYEDFFETARSLDYRRLGKQRVETLQVVKALIMPDYGWKNHPAVKMWKGYLASLYDYQQAICKEWVDRGYKDTCLEKTLAIVSEQDVETNGPPPWLGDPDLHLSHRSNLIRKDPVFYRPVFGDGVPDNLEYVWPTI